jgi:hypothetical protein
MAGADSKDGGAGRASMSGGGGNRSSHYDATKPKLKKARFGVAKSATRKSWLPKKA